MSDAVAEAKGRAAAARARLADTLTELRDWLSPTGIATRMADGLKTKGAEALEGGVEAVREHRWAVAGIATMAGLFLARRPIAALIASDETDAAADGSGPESPTEER